MSLGTRFFFALRFAWRQLTHETAKLLAALLGVMFACVLVFMQMGFKDSLDESIATVVRRISGDIFLVHQQTEALWRTVQFPRTELMRAYAHPSVESAIPLYVGMAQWKNPENQSKRTLMILASEPREMVLNIPAVRPFTQELTRQDTILFDSLSRPEFGPVEKIMVERGRFFTEINDRSVEVLGTFRMGISFATDGNAIASEQNFFRILPQRNPEMLDVGVIRLKPSSDLYQTQRELRQLMNDNVHVFTEQEFVDFEFAYWRNNAPIGFIFGFGMIMGLVVGMVIVYQILFTDITNHLNEFATMKAMGYTHFHLLLVVFCSSLLLAFIGFIPGYLVSLVLYQITESVTFIPMPMPLSKVINVFSMVFIMCMGSGALAMRRMKAVNPADMF